MLKAKEGTRNSLKTKFSFGKGSWISDAIIISVVPVFAYLIVYVYELSYCRFFNIPDALVDVSFRQLLWVIVGIGFYAFVVLTWIVDLDEIKKSSMSAIARSVKIDFMLYSTGIVVVILLLNGRLGYFIFLAVILFLDIFRTYIRPFRAKYKGLSYEHRFERYHRERLNNPNIFANSLNETIGRPTLVTLSFSVLAMFLANAAGHMHAADQVKFPMIEDESNTVVLRIYGDTVITSKILPCTGEVVEPISIRKLSDTNVLNVISRDVGPLLPVPRRDSGLKDFN